MRKNRLSLLSLAMLTVFTLSQTSRFSLVLFKRLNAVYSIYILPNPRMAVKGLYYVGSCDTVLLTGHWMQCTRLMSEETELLNVVGFLRVLHIIHFSQ